MFCPQCKTEYRPGFTKCADCGVDLVTQLPTDGDSGDTAGDAGIPRNSDGLELLWSGVGQSLRNQINDGLDAAHIFHKITDKEFGLLPNLSQSVNLVWIYPRDRARARAILEKALDDSEEVERQPHEELSSDSARVNPLSLGRRVYNRVPESEGRENEDEKELPERDTPGEAVADDIVEDFDPDEATAEVWSGDDQETADYLKMSLEGVGIGCVLHEEGARLRVLVLPESENRAKEIVREVVEGTPPD